MNFMVPTFGIENYADRVERLMVLAPREMAMVEAVILGGLGIAAILFLLIALFRQSAVAAVSFSFLALTALVCSQIFGRLAFVPDGTQVLVLCLGACALLLFATATIRVARDNPLAGTVVLMTIAALLVLGAGSAIGKIDGADLMRLGIATSFGMVIFFMGIEFIRGDRATMTVSPGLFAVMLSPVAMAYVGSQGNDPSWQMTSAPLMVLAMGAVYATIAAQMSLAIGKHRVARAGAMAAAPIPAVPLMREIADDPFEASAAYAPEHQPQGEPRFTPEPIMPHEASSVISEYQDEPTTTPQAVSHNYAAAPASQDTPQSLPQPSYDPSIAPVEPVSASWGRSSGGQEIQIAPIAADEYVWDMMAAQEVRMGDVFAQTMALPKGILASPDILRDSIAVGSLAEFDEAVFGGAMPVTGRFELEARTHNGSVVHLTGRRQVDHEGIMLRIEAQAKQISGPRAQDIVAGAGLAAAAAPLTASRASGSAMASAASLRPGDVKGALARGEIEAHFQPIVRLKDKVTVGFEGLARWRQADGTLLEAKDFVEDIIAAGQGIELAEFVIEQASRELSAWVAAEPDQGQFVTVNVAASDLPKAELISILERAVKTYALPPGALVVELTEGRIRTSQGKAMAAAKAVRQSGVSLAIDDFGVGYSTLNRLSKFRFDLIKTDRSIIRDLSNKKARAFLKTLLATAQKQNAPVIAEGVEDEETAAILAEMGCDFAQGYLFGRAEPLGQSANSGGGQQGAPAQHASAPQRSSSPVDNLR